MRVLEKIIEKYNKEIMSKTDHLVFLNHDEYEKYKKLGDEAICNMPISFIPSKENDVNSPYTEVVCIGSNILRAERFSTNSSGVV